MARGQNYFAWVDAGTPWSEALLRFDESVFSFSVSQEEGGAASLIVQVRNPRVGPLNVGSGRKLWAWFAHDCGGMLHKTFGRLVGIPQSMVGDLVTFEFAARPSNYETLKAALAESLKVLPYYDRAFIDPNREEDDVDAVLEAYTKIWHVDRETHDVTVSDEISGEDGTIILNPGDMLFDGLVMRIPTSPIARVNVNATFNWTQTSSGGGIDLARYITDNWPHLSGVGGFPYIISSYTFGANSWPKAGTTIGDGWVVTFSSTTPLADLTLRHHSEAGKLISNPASQAFTPESEMGFGSGTKVEMETSLSFDYIGGGLDPDRPSPAGSIRYPKIITQDSVQVKFAEIPEGGLGATGTEQVQRNRNYSDTITVVPLLETFVQMHIGFQAGRPFQERVRFTVIADVQPVLTEPEDDMAVILPDLNSVDLSKELSDASDGEVPIGDARSRSYIALERGQESLRYLLALARATLLKRARCVEITVAPLPDFMPHVTLRKNLFVVDDRIPGGEALGKITAYSLALDGETGRLECSVKMQCCVGRGGSHTFTAGEPLYVDSDYVDDDYQEFSDQQLALDAAQDVGFTVPLFAADDDGLNFFSDIDIEDIIEEELVVLFDPATQALHLGGQNPYSTINLPPPSSIPGVGSPSERNQQAVNERNQSLQNTLEQIQTQIRFKLKPMSEAFDTDYDVAVTNLLLPKHIDLETS